MLPDRNGLTHVFSARFGQLPEQSGLAHVLPATFGQLLDRSGLTHAFLGVESNVTVAGRYMIRCYNVLGVRPDSLCKL